MEVQLNVDASAAELAQLAYDWVDQLTMALGPDARAGAVDLPVVEETALKRMSPGDEYVTACVTRLSLSRGRTRVSTVDLGRYMRIREGCRSKTKVNTHRKPTLVVLLCGE